VALHAAGLADAPCVHADARVARKRWRGGSRGAGVGAGSRRSARGLRPPPASTTGRGGERGGACVTSGGGSMCGRCGLDPILSRVGPTV
jgi:hypothetical protein